MRGVDVGMLQHAQAANPDGVRRLARFVGASSVDAYSVALACAAHRRAQVLAPRVRDLRAGKAGAP